VGDVCARFCDSDAYGCVASTDTSTDELVESSMLVFVFGIVELAMVESATIGTPEFAGELSSLPQLIRTVDATRATPAIANR
jgi:hypothetical protein